MTWLLRRAGAGDLDAIMEIERTVFANDAWSNDMMHAELRSPHGYYLVATDADRDGSVLDGYAGLFAPSRSHDGDIQTIAVAESARGKGLGRLLMRSLIERARQQELSQLFLEVRADNPVAKALYDSLGFVEIGVRAGYYQPDDVDAIVMRMTIAPAEPALAAGAVELVGAAGAADTAGIADTAGMAADAGEIADERNPR